MQKSILFIDFNNLCIRTLFGDPEMFKNPTPNFDQHKHVLLATLFSNIKKFGPDEVIIGIDDKQNWRKKVFPDYKARRKDKKDQDIFPWPVYYEYINNFTNQLKELFPFKFIQIPYAEADDVIAVLSRHLTDSINTIVTTDSDYIQLLQNKNIRLYDPLKKKQIIDDNPALTLHIKIVSGDSTDEIPSIKNRVGEKTALKLITSGELENLLKEDIYRLPYERNRRLIDWSFIPDAIKKETLKVYDNYTCINNFVVIDVMKFFVNNKLRKHMEDLSIIKTFIDPLINKNSSIKTFF